MAGPVVIATALPAGSEESLRDGASQARCDAPSHVPMLPQQQQQQQRRKHGRDWLRTLLARHARADSNDVGIDESKALVVAPMVDQSDLPFRLLCRRYGANLAFTPMIHARMFLDRPTYRRKFFNVLEGTPPEDRPLIAQFCGPDKHVLLQAMKLLEPHVDGVDLNCGCPQGIARRGKYGAFLLEQPDDLIEVVSHLSAHLSIPVSVKVRLLPSGVEDSLILYERLIEAGAAMITVHGRNRFQKGLATGQADWDAIRKVVERVGDKVPVIANGSIANLDDVRECLKQTQADGVMSSEAILEYPPLFTESHTASVQGRRIGPGRVDLARQYLDLCAVHPPNVGGQGSGAKCMRVHLHRLLHADLQSNPPIRDAVVKSYTLGALREAVSDLASWHESTGHAVEEEKQSWYVRHRRPASDGTDSEEGDGDEGAAATMTEAERRTRQDRMPKCPGLDDDADYGSAEMFGGGCCGGDDDGDY